MTKPPYKKLLSGIKAFVFDIDGVLTDATAHITSDGESLRTLNLKDTYALQFAISKGYRIGIITRGNPTGVLKVLSRIGIFDTHTEVFDKGACLEAFMAKNLLKKEEVIYMGDDMPDLKALRLVPLSACPQDAVPEVKAVCAYTSHFHGGAGCVRDVIRQVMLAKGDWSED